MMNLSWGFNVSEQWGPVFPAQTGRKGFEKVRKLNEGFPKLLRPGLRVLVRSLFQVVIYIPGLSPLCAYCLPPREQNEFSEPQAHATRTPVQSHRLGLVHMAWGCALVSVLSVRPRVAALPYPLVHTGVRGWWALQRLLFPVRSCLYPPSTLAADEKP